MLVKVGPSLDGELQTCFIFTPTWSVGWFNQLVTDRGIQDFSKTSLTKIQSTKDGDCHERAEGLPRKRCEMGNDPGRSCSPETAS